MNKLNNTKRVAILRCLVEGNSVRSTVRITGAAKNTVIKLLVEAGTVCAEYQDRVFRGLECPRIQCDEIWSFVGCKQKNIPEGRSDIHLGDTWTWVAMSPDTKLVFSWVIGDRGPEFAGLFVEDIASRVIGRTQITTDAYKPYLAAVKASLGDRADYALLVKEYGMSPLSEKRYSPAICLSASKRPVMGNPSEGDIITSHVERQNLTMRMGMRRFTRLTNAFSKKLENHAAAISLHFFYSNFIRVHQSLKTTPAVKQGVADRVWAIDDLVALLD